MDWHWAIVVGVIAAIATTLLAFDRLMTWMESRGWVYWRKRTGSGGMAAAFTELQRIIEPQVKHVIEERDDRICRIDEQTGQVHLGAEWRGVRKDIGEETR